MLSVSFMSYQLAPSSLMPMGRPYASTKRLRLTPPLPRSVGLAQVFFPERSLVQRTVEGTPFQVQTNHLVVLGQGLVPQARPDASLYPVLKPAVSSRAAANTLDIQHFPLATRAQNKENAVEYLPVRDPLPVAAQGVGPGRMHGQ